MRYSAPSFPFLGSHPARRPHVILLGAPLDCTATFRSGTGRAPDRIRLVADSIESYSPVLDRDLEELRFVDRGDLSLADLDLDAALSTIQQATAEASKGALVVLLGGEHTITLAAMRALHPRYADLAILQLDAHLDLIQEFQDRRVSQATVFRRIGDELGLGNLVQLGVRSGTRAEFQAASQCFYSSPALGLPRHVFDWLRARPVYISLDIDVLDPAHAPGTGNPEPGGPTFSELLELLYSLRSLRVVGFDVVEVLPAVDYGDITAIAAAKLAREMILLFA